MANSVYNHFKKELANGTFNFTDNTFKIMLVTSSYTPDIDADKVYEDVTNEVVGAGYVAGGATLANLLVSQDDGDDEGVVDNTADITWGSSSITARGAVVYRDGDSGKDSDLVCFIDFTTDKTSDNGDFTIQFDSEGILNIN